MKFLRCSLYLTVISFFLLNATILSASYFDEEIGLDNSGGFKVFGEYLYWKPIQDQMQYASRLRGGAGRIIEALSEPNFIRFSETISVKEPSFKFDSGFRIGVGYEIPCSDWGFQLSWTRFHQKVSSSISDNNLGIIPINFPIASLLNLINRNPLTFQFASKAQSHWKFEFDTVDFYLGKSCSITKNSVIRPYIGVKGAFIQQRQTVKYFGFTINALPVTTRVQKKNDFNSVGPSLGTDLMWKFAPHFSLISGISGSLLYGKFHVKENPSIFLEPIEASLTIKTSRKHRIRPMVDLYVGLDWDTCLFESLLIKIGVAYETQYWWNQWQVPNSVESSLTGSSQQGDLMLHGLTVNAAFIF